MVRKGAFFAMTERNLTMLTDFYEFTMANGYFEKGIGNRVVGIKDSKIVDFDIQEALSMTKPYDEKLHHICEEIAF